MDDRRPKITNARMVYLIELPEVDCRDSVDGGRRKSTGQRRRKLPSLKTSQVCSFRGWILLWRRRTRGLRRRRFCRLVRRLFHIVFLGHLGKRRDLVAVVEVHDAHALGITADDADLAHVSAVDHALHRDEHDVVVLADGGNADHRAVAFRGANVAQALATAALLAVAHGGSVLGAFFAGSFFALGAFRGGWLWRRGFFHGFFAFNLRHFAGDIGAERRAFAVAVFTNREQEAF